MRPQAEQTKPPSKASAGAPSLPRANSPVLCHASSSGEHRRPAGVVPLNTQGIPRSVGPPCPTLVDETPLAGRRRPQGADAIAAIRTATVSERPTFGLRLSVFRRLPRAACPPVRRHAPTRRFRRAPTPALPNHPRAGDTSHRRADGHRDFTARRTTATASPRVACHEPACYAAGSGCLPERRRIWPMSCEA